MKKTIAISVLIIIILATGCQMINDLWPAQTPYIAQKYAEVNKPVWDCIGELEKTRQAVISKHIEQQIDLKYQMEKDSAKYDLAIGQVNINLQQAKAERDTTIGSIDKPGWLIGLLLGTTGIGAYLVGYKTQRPEDYNEAEHQQAIVAIKSEQTKTPA